MSRYMRYMARSPAHVHPVSDAPFLAATGSSLVGEGEQGSLTKSCNSGIFVNIGIQLVSLIIEE
jgi:hypothetical protein